MEAGRPGRTIAIIQVRKDGVLSEESSSRASKKGLDLGDF